MKKLHSALLLGFSLLLGFVGLAPIASAQVVTPNYWVQNFASSTIAPRNPSLQVPCANIASGCGGGAASTSINGVLGPTFTFSIAPTSSPSSITTSSAQVFLNLLQYTSSTDITVTPTGTIIFNSHNIS